MEQDIVERLRAEANALGEEWPDEAANEIERLRKKVAALEYASRVHVLGPEHLPNMGGGGS